MSLAAPTANSRMAALRTRLSPPEWRRLWMMGAFIVALHVVGFALLLGRRRRPLPPQRQGRRFGIGTGMLAYTLGHAPRLRRRPHLGHRQHHPEAHGRGRAPAVRRVLLLPGPLQRGLRACPCCSNFGIRALNSQVGNNSSGLHHYTSLIGTSVSGAFLYLIAILNVVILVSIVRMFVEMRRGRFDARGARATSSTRAG